MFIKDWYREIKYFVQRGKKGYSDRDLWDFDDYLNRMIPPALRLFAKRKYSCPSEFWDKENTMDECHKWKEALEEMAQGFEAADAIKHMKYFYTKKTENGGYTHEVDREKLDLLSRKFDRGMELFSKHYMNLWD